MTSGRELVAVLEERVRSMRHGERVPSEHDIMARYEVSRSLARSALRELEARYLVRRVQGAGTFVNERLDYVISRSRKPSLHATIAEAGRTARTFVVAIGSHSAPEPLADTLNVAPGTPLVRLERMAYVDDEPTMFLQEWLAPDVILHPEVGLTVIESVEELLRGSGHDPVRAWFRATVDPPPPLAHDRLALPRGSRTWVVDSCTRDGGTGRPLMASRAWTRIDVIRIVCELDDDFRPAP